MSKNEIVLYQPDYTAAGYVKTTEQNGRIIFMRDGAIDKPVKPTQIDVSKIVNDDGSHVDLKSASELRRWLIQKYDGKKVALPVPRN
ncbi:MAG: hypothetical protein FWE57_09700 [Chitinispirillia bacterium]|nr:hypothetical protein [Chitinispirillia bacterium]